MWVLFYGFVDNKLMWMVISELERGMRPHWTLDAFAAITVSQVFCLFSPYYGGLVLWLGPIYLVYKFGGMALKFFFPSKQAEPEATPEDDKKAAKKEKKQERVKYAKH